MKYEASEQEKKKISDHAVLINRAEIAIRVGQSSRVDKCEVENVLHTLEAQCNEGVHFSHHK